MLEVADDGTVTVLSGCSDIGQGSDTALCQIVAEELGVPYDNVRIISSDTAFTPDALATTASRQTLVSGKAVQLAARDAKDHLLRYASDLLKCTRDELDVKDNVVVSSKDPALSMPFPELSQKAHANGKRFIGFAWYDNTTKDVDHETNQGDAYACYIYATQVVDVEVDDETGEVNVLRIFAAHDVGRAINPMMVEQQIEGAVVQGMGYGMMEEVILEKGITKTPSFTKYLIPTILDAPEIRTAIIEEPVERGPFGAKGVGEGAIIPLAVALVNAVYDAIGIRFKSLPITPEKVLAALSEKQDKTGALTG
jgi:CO/xanthine dehydrogenase Mo-binding subunit